MPENCVYVGRPTIWGNPFTGDDAVERYELAISEFPVPQERIDEWKSAGGITWVLIALSARVRGVLNQLKGKDLACWCPLTNKDGTPCLCHADVLLRIANATPSKMAIDRRGNDDNSTMD